MHLDSLSASSFDLGALTAESCVAELLARETVTLIETDAFGCATGVFRYSAAALDQIVRPFVGLLLLDESVALVSLSPEEALRVADLIEDFARAEAGRTTKILSADRPVPGLDALGFEHDPDTLDAAASLAVERLRREDGYPAPGIGIWYETGDSLNQPGDTGFGGGFTAFGLDQASRIVSALRTAAI